MNFYLKLSVFKLIVVLIVLPKCRAVQSPNGDTTISNEPQITSATAAIEVEAPTVDGNKTFDRLQLRQPHNGSSDNYTYLITGGYQPPQHTLAKYLVSISYGDYTKYYGDNHICGGAIIQPQLIITAAHCLQYITRMPFFTTVEPNIVAGTPNRLQRTHNTQARTGEKQIAHPQYDYFSHRNDIALIFLDSALKLTDYVEVIPLPEAPVAPGTPCTVFGWGRIFEDGPLTAEVLYANVQIWSNALCRTYAPIYVDTAICANNIRDNDVDACSGDSGGPLICDGRLAGIVSFGVGCATPGFPGFYTDVYQFLDWIYDPNTLSGSGKTDVVAVHIVVALAVWWRL